MALFRRFISPADIGRHASELRIVFTPFQKPLLEFLERERIIVPVARIHWPRSLVIETHGGKPETPPTATERMQAECLRKALLTWRLENSDPLEPHPLDRDAAEWRDLLTTDIALHPFRSWEEFRTNIEPADDSPPFATDAVDTYYHGWQALLLADALDMGMSLIFDLRKETLFEAARRCDWPVLIDAPKFPSVSFQGLQGIKASEKWLRHFDAVARYKETCQRILNAADRTECRGGSKLEISAHQEVREKEREAGRNLLRNYDIG